MSRLRDVPVRTATYLVFGLTAVIILITIVDGVLRYLGLPKETAFYLSVLIVWAGLSLLTPRLIQAAASKTTSNHPEDH